MFVVSGMSQSLRCVTSRSERGGSRNGGVRFRTWKRVRVAIVPPTATTSYAPGATVASPKDALVDREHVVDDDVPVVAADRAAAGAAEARPQGLVVEQLPERRGERSRVARRHEAPALGRQYGAVAGNVGRDHGEPGGHRLEQDDPEALAAERGRAEDVRAREHGAPL